MVKDNNKNSKNLDKKLNLKEKSVKKNSTKISNSPKKDTKKNKPILSEIKETISSLFT
jgi:hypothetical protein